MNRYAGSAAELSHSARDADKAAMQVINAVRRGEPEAAAPIAEKLIQRFPKHAGVQQAMAEVCVAMGKFDEAIIFAKRSVKLTPEETMPYIVLSMCLRKAHQEDKAFRALKKAAKCARGNAGETSMVGHFFERMQAMDQAISLFRRAHELEPNNSDHLQRIAGVQRYQGDLAGAEDSYDKALSFNDEEWLVYALRSGLRKQTSENNHIDEIKALLQRGTAIPQGKSQLLFALAKEYEDIEDYRNAFRYLKLGCENQRRLIDYDLNGDLTTIREITETFDAARFVRGAEGCQSAEPIFILGMPRTGTTLVERILSSHSRVESLGEMDIFAKLMVRDVKESYGSQVIPPSQRTRLTAQIDFRKVGQGYVDSVRDRRGREPHFIDKLPYNFLHVGPIHLALPNAKIIQLVRHPMDTCYSVYKQLFSNAYPFSYDLEELGRYFVAYTKLMNHWNETLPGVIHRVQYEEMVANQEFESRRLIEYCGLEWEDGVIEFHKNTRASTTASASQIRSPIYKSSVQKWRQYEEQLAPLRKVLEDNGINTD